MNLSGPVTDAEQTLWQRRAHAVLADFLETAARRGLPPVSWTISLAGNTLVARAPDRAAWHAWQAALHLPDVSPELIHGGFVRAGRRAVQLPGFGHWRLGLCAQG